MSSLVDRTAATIAIVGFSAAAFCSGFIIGVVLLSERLRDEAVSAGVAEYYLDADHNRQWRWLNDREGE